jgi:hypothetical protein
METKQVHLRIDSRLYDEISKRARKDFSSVQDYIVHSLIRKATIAKSNTARKKRSEDPYLDYFSTAK